MKKITILIISFLPVFQLSIYAQLRPIADVNRNTLTTATPVRFSTVPARELNTFRNFNESFDGDSKINAYLMSYISWLMYPERLNRLLTGTIWGDNDQGNTNDALFESNFKKKFEPLFWDGISETSRPSIKFKRLPANSPARNIGMDPEAAIVSTPEMIIVAFRGTDRVLSKDEMNRQFGEWLGTDFKAQMVEPGPGKMVGKVHAGFWESIDLLRSDLDYEIRLLDPSKTKQIWITGHSLGAAQAQLYAQYLVHSSLVPSSRIHCYSFDGPSFIGDQTYANSVNSLGNKFQRFEYQMDMVSVFAPGIATRVGGLEALIGGGCFLTCSYAKSGRRNWFENDITYRFNFRERDLLKGDIMTPNSGCEHNPNWLVRALYNRLSDAEKAMVPDQAPCDRLGLGCNPDCSPVTVASATTAFAEIAWQNITTGLTNLSNNLLGGGDGNYRISCYRYKNYSKKYLNWNGTLSSQLTLSDNPTTFTLTHKLTGGYQLSKSSGTVAADVEYLLGVPSGTEKSSRIITRPKDIIIGDEETWFLLKVPNHTNTYVLYNWNTRKVLSAGSDQCVTGGNCGVIEKNAKDSDGSQVWIFEKVN
jgi:hypothetical protein